MEDYKEKYENALERCKKEFNFNNLAYSHEEIKQRLEHIFPELKEDERIRKALIQHIKYKVSVISCWRKEELIAWLEKQDPNRLEKEIELAYKTADEVQYRNGFKAGQNEVLENLQKYGLEKQREQKPEIKYIYPKFRVGDVIEPAKPNGHYVPVRVKYIGEGAYSCESDDRKVFFSLPICDENEYVLTEQKPTQWTDKDWYYYNKLEYFLEVQDHYSPTESSSSYQKDVHETLLWLKSLHPNKHVTWSEEDEEIFDSIIANMQFTQKAHPLEVNQVVYERDIDWLKSLKKRMKGE